MPIGVIYGFAAYAAYAVADAIIKGFGQSISVFEIIFLTTLFSIVPVALTKPKDERLSDLFRNSHPLLLHFRSMLMVFSVMLVIYSFTTVPLAEVYAILFLTPVFVTILSKLFLREAMSLRRWAILALGFAGVLVVVRPGFRELFPGHAAALICAVLASVAAVILRFVSTQEKRTTIVAFATLYQLSFNFALMVWAGVEWPAVEQWLLLAAIGALGGTGHLLIIHAVSTAPANLVAPTQYSQIIWAVVLGAVFYAEFPDTVAYAGLAMVAVSGLFNATPARARSWFGAQVLLLRAKRQKPADRTDR